MPLCVTSDDSAWLFLSTILEGFNFVDFPYSNPVSMEIDQHDALTSKWRYYCCGVMALLSLPFVYQKSLAKLRFVSLFILLVMIYTIVLVLCQFWTYFSYFEDSPDYKIEWLSNPFNIRWFQGWATMMLSYFSQILFFYVRGEMISKTKERVTKLIDILTFVVIVFFATFSTIAYLSLGEKMLPSLFTLRRKLRKFLV